MTKEEVAPSNTPQKAPSRFTKLLGSAWFWVGIIATLLGLWEGIDHAREVAHKRAREKIMQTTLVSSGRMIHVGRSDEIREVVLVADKIEVAGGDHAIPAGSVWLANEVSLTDGATLKATTFSIVAKSLNGGVIDAAGSTPAAAGANGTSGGDLFILANKVANLELVTRGGDGAPGGPGPAGRDGRDGSCAGFGGYRGADRGGDGGNGQPGGIGGSGGRIRIAAAELSPSPSPINYAAGRGGSGGAAGRGGHGGTGCTGLGGSQPNQPDGSPGQPAPDGHGGSPGSFELKPVAYDKVLEIVGMSRDPNAVLNTALAAFETGFASPQPTN